MRYFLGLSLPLAAIFLITFSSLVIAGEMTSTNYTITTTVISGGGSPMTSTSYQLTCTLGQPSPLIDPAFPPRSTSYDLLTGFWYTIGSSPPFSACPADLDTDGDVDDDDLYTLATDFGQSGLETDADLDSDMDGRDLYEMVVDFSRTDCMP